MLETKRLWLRSFVPDDVGDVLEYTSQAAVAKSAGFMLCRTEQQALFFGQLLQKQDHLVIELKEENKVIGNIGLSPLDVEKKHSFEVGYALNKNYWQKGYMTEALSALCEAAKEKRIKVIEARVADHNLASIKVLERCGFKFVKKYVIAEWFVASENQTQLLFKKVLGG